MNIKLNNNALYEAGVENNTDKAVPDRTLDLSYLHIYDMYLSRFRDIHTNMLEIGTRRGNSLKTWEKYFNKLHLFGIDIDEGASQKLIDEGFTIEIGYQQDHETIENIVSRCLKETGRERGTGDQSCDFGSRAFDIIIDDGSHINRDIIMSFSLLWKHLSHGGLYVIEDLYSSYDKYISQDKPFNSRPHLNEFFNEIIKKVDDCGPRGPHLRAGPPLTEKTDPHSVRREIQLKQDTWIENWSGKKPWNEMEARGEDFFFLHFWDSIVVIGKTPTDDEWVEKRKRKPCK